MSADTEPVRLELGRPVVRDLAGGGSHEYLVRVEEGQYLRLTAEQRGIDVKLHLLAPDGSVVREVDGPNGNWGPETASDIAKVAGDYRAEVKAGDKAKPGLYEMRLEELRPAEDQDPVRVEAEGVFHQGEKLRVAREWQPALERYERFLALSRSASDRSGEALALYRIGWMQQNLDDWPLAVETLGRSIAIYREIGDAGGEAAVLNKRGGLLSAMERQDEALAAHERALDLSRSAGNLYEEAGSLNNIGAVHYRAGRSGKAIEAYNIALPLFRKLDSRKNELATLINLGSLYVSQNKRQEARDAFESAIRTAEQEEQTERLAMALSSLGELELRDNLFDTARGHLERALDLHKTLKDSPGQAVTLVSLGNLFLKTGELDHAQAYNEEALAIFRKLGDPQGEALVLSNLGRIQFAREEDGKAVRRHREARAIFERIGDRSGIASARFGAAQSLARMKDLDAARLELEEGVEHTESLRAEASSLDFRAAFFASKQHYWDLYIDVLMQLARQNSDPDLEVLALQASERRRARSLLDALQAQAREGGPRLAALERPEPLGGEESRRLLDQNTLLLIYSLGEDRSFLWTVSSRRIESHDLPGRSEIDTVAGELLVLLPRASREAQTSAERVAQRLSDLVLKPAAGRIEGFRRLVIIGDGALQAVPFAALPHPGLVAGGAERETLLIEHHEIGYLPSASVLATLRRLPNRSRKPGEELRVAVIADPVFSADDPRVQGEGAPAIPLPSLEELSRSVEQVGLGTLEPLPYTRQEASSILSMVKGKPFSALGFDATRELFSGGRLRDYHIVHVATHSLMNSREPDFSGIVFSLVDPQGRPRDGFLRLRDIYNLDIGARLVVLSACQTGVGKEIRGEGLQGITRGFMSAGVPQLVVSLWKVDDRSTAELMKRFYHQLLEEGNPPMAALRKAQLSMLRDPFWRQPRHWAGFIFQGDFQLKPDGDIEEPETAVVVKKASSDLPPPKMAPDPPKKPLPPQK